MTNEELLGKIYATYVELLRTREQQGEVMKRTPEEIATRMFDAVRNDVVRRPTRVGYADWLKHNPTMARAARKHGINSSVEFRQLFL